jgi:hypothetical protein
MRSMLDPRAWCVGGCAYSRGSKDWQLCEAVRRELSQHVTLAAETSGGRGLASLAPAGC